MTNLMQKFFHDEKGATAIEYGLIAALVGAAIVGGISSLGGNMSTMFTNLSVIVGPSF